MALENCKECGKEVSTSATKCPSCGIGSPTLTKEKIIKNTIAISLVLLMFIAIWNAEKRVNRLVGERPQNFNHLISEYAIDVMTEDQYPKTYKIWGEEKIKWINSLQEPAAIYALKYMNCDYVEFIALSPAKSYPPDRVVFNVDCKNGTRHVVSNVYAWE